GAPVVAGRSLKTALDLDWDDPSQRQQALTTVLAALDAATAWCATRVPTPAAVHASLAAAQQVRPQDVDESNGGAPVLRPGVARNRRISIEDGVMRHGRKSRRVRVDGYKRHALHDLDRGLVRAVGVTAANVPDAQVTDAIVADLQAQQTRLAELHIDRASLSSPLVRDRPPERAPFCTAWAGGTGARFPQAAFTLGRAARAVARPH